MKVSALFMVIALSLTPLRSYAFGDLFLTSSQRQLINNMRERNGAEWQMQPQTAGTLKINGFYYKSRERQSKSVVWLNGQQVPNTGRFNGGNAQSLNKRDKTVGIKLDGAPRSLSFKAGQKLQLNQLNVVDGYQ